MAVEKDHVDARTGMDKVPRFEIRVVIPVRTVSRTRLPAGIIGELKMAIQKQDRAGRSGDLKRRDATAIAFCLLAGRRICF